MDSISVGVALIYFESFCKENKIQTSSQSRSIVGNVSLLVGPAHQQPICNPARFMENPGL